MTVIMIVVVGALACLFVGQGVLVGWFVARVAWWKPMVQEPYTPKAVVILCLRGADPFLAKTLAALAEQDYPDYDVVLVIDNEHDPARQIVDRFLESHPDGRFHVQFLTERLATCSLKCSSLVQVTRQLDPSWEVVVLIDADAVPRPNWLRSLVAPMHDGRISVTSGNRWFMPSHRSWGGMVRLVWNSAAVVQMTAYGYMWGGSLAIRRRVFEGSDLIEYWSRVFTDDTSMVPFCREKKHRYEFVPSQMILNREDCTIGSCYTFIQRQLLTARLYHPLWPATVLHGLGSPVAVLAALGLLIHAIVTGSGPVVLVAASLGIYLLSCSLLYLALEWTARRRLRAEGVEVGRWAFLGILQLLVAIYLTQVIYPPCIIGTLLLRRTVWRGVTYRVDGPQSIGLVDDAPYQEQQAGETVSL